jgi:hypothetical protein
MRRHLAASALFAAGLVAMTATAQPPAGDKAPPPKPAEKKAADKKADPVEGLIEAALAHDPDVRLARAKIQLAEAELAKARQGVALKVTNLRAAIEERRLAVAHAEAEYAATERTARAVGAPPAEVLLAPRSKLETAKAALARAEAELKLLVGDGPRAAALADPTPPRFIDPAVLSSELLRADHTASLLATILAAQKRPSGPAPACNHCHDVARDGDLLGKDWHGCPGILQNVQPAAPAAPKGPIPDRLRAALDKPVALGPKGRPVRLDQALEAFKKEAGLDVPVRHPFPAPGPDEAPALAVESGGEALPVGAWLQLFEDQSRRHHFGDGKVTGHRFYLREYGLLFCEDELAPPGAVLVLDFWKQKPAAKTPPAPTRVMIRRGGKQAELQGAEADALAASALQLVEKAARTETRPIDPKGWAAAVQARPEFVAVELPNAEPFVPGTGVPAALVVGLSRFPDPDPVVLLHAKSRLEGGDVLYSASEFPPEAAQAFADILRRIGPVK